MKTFYSILTYLVMSAIAVGAYILIKDQFNKRKEARPKTSSQSLTEFEEKLDALNTRLAKLVEKQEKNPMAFSETQNAAIIRLSEDIGQLEQSLSEWRENKDADDWTRYRDLAEVIYDEALKLLRSLPAD